MQLESLVIPIDLDTGLLIKGAELAMDAIKGLADQFVNAINMTREWGDELDNLQDNLGGTAEQVAGLNVLIHESGMNTDAAVSAFDRFAKGLKTSNGQLGTSGKALQGLGINIMSVDDKYKQVTTRIKDSDGHWKKVTTSVLVANGTMKDSTTIFQEVADKITAMPDGLAKDRIEMDLFGKSGTAMNDMLALAANGGMQQAIDRAKEMGLVFDPQIVKNFDIAWSDLGMTGQGLQVVFSQGLLPSITGLVQEFTFLLGTPWIKDALAGVSDKLSGLVNDITAGIATGDWSALKTDIEQDWNIYVAPAFEQWLVNADTWARENGSGFMSSLINGLFGGGTSNKGTGVSGEDIPGIAGLGQKLVDDIIDAIVNANWSPLGHAIIDKLNEGADENQAQVREVGDKIGKWIADALIKPLQEAWDSFLKDLSSYQFNNPKTMPQTKTTKGYAAGTSGWETVPSGYPNDTYMVGLTSGEAFNVSPNGQARGNGFSVANMNVVVNSTDDEMAIALRIKGAVGLLQRGIV